MTAISSLRASLLATIRSILPDAEVLESRTPEGWFVLNPQGSSAVVVSYAGKPQRRPGPVGKRVDQDYVFRFTVAVTGENWADPAGAVYEAADTAEFLFGSPTLPPDTPNLRNQSIGTIAGEPIYLRFVDETFSVAPNSTAEGGRFAIVQTWETGEIRL